MFSAASSPPEVWRSAIHSAVEQEAPVPPMVRVIEPQLSRVMLPSVNRTRLGRPGS